MDFANSVVSAVEAAPACMVARRFLQVNVMRKEEPFETLMLSFRWPVLGRFLSTQGR